MGGPEGHSEEAEKRRAENYEKHLAKLKETKPSTGRRDMVYEKATKETQNKIRKLAGLICDQGYSRQDILSYVTEVMGYSYAQATLYYTATMNYLAPKNEDEFVQEVRTKNYNRLESMYKQAIESNDRRLALDVIKTQNAMFGLSGGGKVELKKEEKDGSMQSFTITFGE